MNKLRFNFWHLFILLIVVHLGGFRAPQVFQGTTDFFHNLIEYYRGTEAFMRIGEIRRLEIEACYINNGGSYKGCFNRQKIKEYNNDPLAYFEYNWTKQAQNDFTITAVRRTHGGGDPKNTITLTRKGKGFLRKGEGLFWFIF